MATELKDTTRTDLEHDPTFERFRAALIEEPERYPRGAVFISAEEPWAPTVMLRHIRAGEPVVMVFADGEERIISPERPPHAIATGMLLKDVVSWAASMARRAVRREPTIH